MTEERKVYEKLDEIFEEMDQLKMSMDQLDDYNELQLKGEFYNASGDLVHEVGFELSSTNRKFLIKLFKKRIVELQALSAKALMEYQKGRFDKEEKIHVTDVNC